MNTRTQIHHLSRAYRNVCEPGATRMTHTPWFPVILLILAASPASVSAQSTDRETAVEAVKAGELVRLDVVRIGRMEGPFLATNDSTFTLTRNGEPAQVQLGDIERLWVRGRSTGKGARIGALVGGVLGIAFGIWVAKTFSICGDYEDEPCVPTLGGAAVGGLVGGAGGGLLGAGIGFAIPTWRLRFP